ncbi:MAG: type IV secretory system conjugative DNA transfer family protein [Planctomycetaceae bacterium]
MARLSAVSQIAMVVILIVLAAFVSPVLGILLTAVTLWRLNVTPKQGGTSHGSARWASAEDLLNAGCLFGSGVPIGRTLMLRPVLRLTATKALLLLPLNRSREAMALADAGASRPKRLPLCIPSGRYPHTVVFGASGSGKSSCYSVPLLLDCGDSMVVLDPKGELARMTARHRAQHFGHDIRIIDPFGTTEGCGFPQDRLNPLALFRDDSSRIVDEARRMASALIESTGNETDKFWPKSSAALVTGVLAFLIAEARSEEANLNTLRDILTNPSLMEDVLKHMQHSDACSGLLRRLSGQLGQLQGQTRASVYSVANSHIDFLDSLPIAEALADSTFDARQLIHGRQTIYLCLPVDRLAELAGLQRVLLSTLINLVFAAGEDRCRRVRFLLDEAATLGAMDSLYAAVQFGRSFGLNLTFLFQSTSQVERCFPASQKDSFHATVASVFCGINDLQTAKEVSDWIGQTTVEGRTTQVGWNQGVSASNDFSGQPKSTNRGSSDSRSYAETARLLLRPEEVLQLPSHAAVALIPGVRPILAEKVPWFARRRSGVFASALSAVRSLVATACGVAIIGGAAWLMTSGQSHPQVIALQEQFRREFQPTASSQIQQPGSSGRPGEPRVRMSRSEQARQARELRNAARRRR